MDIRYCLRREKSNGNGLDLTLQLTVVRTAMKHSLPAD